MHARAVFPTYAAALVFASGCVGPEVESHVAAPHAAVQLPVALVLDDVVPAGPSATSIDTVVAQALDDELARDLTGAAVRVVPESEVGHQGVVAPPFELSFRVLRAADQLDGYPPEATAAVVGGVLTAGLGAIPLTQIRRGASHVLLVELRVYDLRASGLRVVQDAATAQLERRYDTTDAPMVLRTHYWVQVRTASGVTSGPPGSVDALRLQRDEGFAAARELATQALPDVDRAIAIALADPAPVPTAAPTGTLARTM